MSCGVAPSLERACPTILRQPACLPKLSLAALLSPASLPATAAAGPAPPAAAWWQALVLSDGWLLKEVVDSRTEQCRKELEAQGWEGRLCQALVREELWRGELLGLVPQYDR